jgi:uncharacterized protein YndB with AHSA1/START domain
MEPIQTRADSRIRLFAAKPAEVFAAMSDPARVARWWGPAGFTNTIEQFDFRPGGVWLLTMHGPDGRDHPNENRFTRIVANEAIEIEHPHGPHFMLSLELKPHEGGTELHWRQLFDTVAQYQVLADFIAQANEENLDRLAAEIESGKSSG